MYHMFVNDGSIVKYWQDVSERYNIDGYIYLSKFGALSKSGLCSLINLATLEFVFGIEV